MAGSFCLFCANGPVGLPTVTSGSWGAEPLAATATNAGATKAITAAARPLALRIIIGCPLSFGHHRPPPSGDASPPRPHLSALARRRPVVLSGRSIETDWALRTLGSGATGISGAHFGREI